MLLSASLPAHRGYAAQGDEGALAEEAAARRRAGWLRSPAGRRIRHDDAGRGDTLSHPCLAAFWSCRHRISRLQRCARARAEKMGRRLYVVLPAPCAEAWRQASCNEDAGQRREAEASHQALSRCALYLHLAQSAESVSFDGEALARALFHARLAQSAEPRSVARRLRARHVRSADRGLRGGQAPHSERQAHRASLRGSGQGSDRQIARSLRKAKDWRLRGCAAAHASLSRRAERSPRLRVRNAARAEAETDRAAQALHRPL